MSPGARIFRVALPLPAFVLHPLTAMILAAVHAYLAAAHLAELVAGHVDWTNVWKGFGALAGAYVFIALASRRASSPRSSRMSPGAVGGSSI
jgi:ABC-type transport system involved in cytochrome c biogenesis permease subunit